MNGLKAPLTREEKAELRKVWAPQAFGPKGYMASVRPADARIQAKWMLDVYFSALHHQMADGGGSGDPEWRGIFGSKRQPEPGSRESNPPDSTSSERPYGAFYFKREVERRDGTKAVAYFIPKYHSHARSDPRVLAAKTAVEPLLAKFPDTLGVYLATKYPRSGNYQPCLCSEIADAWFADSARAFIEAGVERRAFRRGGKAWERDFAKRLRSMERALLRQIEAHIEGRQKTRPLENIAGPGSS